MKIGGTHYRSVWPIGEDAFGIIDQTRLPHEFVTLTLRSAQEAAHAIKSMQTRGAPLIGVVGAYGLALAVREDAGDDNIQKTVEMLEETRPTAINLKWALWRMRGLLMNQPHGERARMAWAEAAKIADEDVAMSEAIGWNGLKIIERIAEKKQGRTVNILTHCNAGWLATVDYGTALAPIYMAHDAGIPLHVWVDETRPRGQGASLTAFELGSHGVPHAILADNAGGHYMQNGQVDLVIVGTDRVTANGDVANKIGTYLKALAAHDNGVPFYVALPSSTIDWTLDSGADIPIEERSQDEVLKTTGRTEDGKVVTVHIAAPGSPAANPGFDVTPARLVTGLITERGTCTATPEGLRALFPKS
ncbi:MAG: S-methyl-5-thioribose-1-phosphate isomerase [Alphaproteobacteria bacterium 64-11]|nr:S-methyl-5-thioribose-1-phosphate isomerase [Alphaproteobacteria bacterium]OJU13993.1 MAG: S-methyl-5-thioribose-1-phosphate isomerase [Alphaproteobacteria bacterium 64-11]